jgi:hypothetical protein
VTLSGSRGARARASVVRALTQEIGGPRCAVEAVAIEWAPRNRGLQAVHGGREAIAEILALLSQMVARPLDESFTSLSVRLCVAEQVTASDPKNRRTARYTAASEL